MRQLRVEQVTLHAQENTLIYAMLQAHQGLARGRLRNVQREAGNNTRMEKRRYSQQVRKVAKTYMLESAATYEISWMRRCLRRKWHAKSKVTVMEYWSLAEGTSADVKPKDALKNIARKGRFIQLCDSNFMAGDERDSWTLNWKQKGNVTGWVKLRNKLSAFWCFIRRNFKKVLKTKYGFMEDEVSIIK